MTLLFILLSAVCLLGRVAPLRPTPNVLIVVMDNHTDQDTSAPPFSSV